MKDPKRVRHLLRGSVPGTGGVRPDGRGAVKPFDNTEVVGYARLSSVSPRRFLATVLAVATVGTVVACGLSVTGSADDGASSGASSSSSSSSSGGPSPDPFDGSFVEDSGPPILTDAAPGTSCLLGDAGVGATGTSCNGTCVDTSRDRRNCGTCGTVCDPAAACEGTCVPVAEALKGWRVELPCTGSGAFGYCDCPDNRVTKEITLTGTPGKSYRLLVRFRGVVEQKEIVGSPTSGGAVGLNATFFVQNGNPKNDDWTLLQLDVASPESRFYLNRGASGHDYSDVFDYIGPITVAAGTKLTLSLEPYDRYQSPARSNSGANLTAPGLAFFNGELVQLDVVSATLVP